MKRIALFLATNLAILVLLSIAVRVLGFGGALISLAMSKWTAKAMGSATRSPTSQTATW